MIYSVGLLGAKSGNRGLTDLGSLPGGAAQRGLLDQGDQAHQQKFPRMHATSDHR